MSLPEIPRRAARADQGFTMIFVVMVLFVSSLLVAGAFAAAQGDIHLTRTNTAQDKAYFAAQAGVQVFQYQLNTSPNYWTTCPHTPEKEKVKEPVKVPATSDETYTYETLPATGHAACESGKQNTIVESGTANGTFRIKATGKSGGKSRSIVATFTHPGFLNYVFLSNYEIEDPVTHKPEPANCEHYYEYRVKNGLTGECPAIPFIGEDKVDGPFHTNDSVDICGGFGGNPTFGRTSADKIEMDGGHYSEGCGSNTLNMVGTLIEKGPTLLPPETSGELLEAAEYKFSGRTIIELKSGSPNTMAVTLSDKTKETKPFPANGVVYVENGKAGCGVKYTPFFSNYTTDTECGNVYIKGTYTESLTVAAANDVIVNGNIETTNEKVSTPPGKPTGAATLGLIATNFVRVYHPVVICTIGVGGCQNNSVSCSAENLSAAADPNGWGPLKDPVIDAAILSTKHSWIVDNFTCGKPLGELTVWGTIAQFWRGRVTAGFGGGGYIKSYNYDDRLATNQPPSFLAPTTTGGWKASRETAPPE